MNREEAAAPGVTEVEDVRQRECYRRQHRETGELDVLEDANGDAVRALPVRGIGQPVRESGDSAHPACVHGVRTRCTSTRLPSARTARTTDPRAPTTSGVLKKSWMPRRMK